MPASEPGKIRNVAVVGHRGTGKTSLVEALLYESGAVNRLGSVGRADHRLRLRRRGAHAADVDLGLGLPRRVGGAQDQPDRHARRRRASRPTCSRRCASSRARSSSSRAVMGVEVGTERAVEALRRSSASRASCSSTCSTASAPTSSRRSSRSRSSSRRTCVAVELPIGAEHEFRRRRRPGAHGRLPSTARARGATSRSTIPDDLQATGRRVPRQADGRRRRDRPTS